MEPHAGNQRPSEGELKHTASAKTKYPELLAITMLLPHLARLTRLRSSWCQQWPGPKPAHRSPEDRSCCPAQAWRSLLSCHWDVEMQKTGEQRKALQTIFPFVTVSRVFRTILSVWWFRIMDILSYSIQHCHVLCPLPKITCARRSLLDCLCYQQRHCYALKVQNKPKQPGGQTISPARRSLSKGSSLHLQKGGGHSRDQDRAF